MKKVLVVFGGVSQEHDISVLTGVLTVNSVDTGSFEAIPVYVDGSGSWYTGEALRNVAFYKKVDFKKLKRVTFVIGDAALYCSCGKKLRPIGRIDCAINCLHGRNGEDGSFAGLCRLCGIPLASPDIFSSAASLDKVKTKIMLEGLGVATAEYTSVERRSYYGGRHGYLEKIETSLGFPVIVKPSDSGSSIGISVAKDGKELFAAFDKAFRYGELAIVEKYLEGASDVNCAAYRSGNTIVVSECERPVAKGSFLTFSDKYSASKYGAEKEFPAKISENIRGEIRSITETVYKAFGFTGVVRIDYLVVGKKVYLNEINSVPGSLAYYLFSEKLKDFSKMLTALIGQGIRERLYIDGTETHYSSDVLSFKGVALKK